MYIWHPLTELFNSSIPDHEQLQQEIVMRSLKEALHTDCPLQSRGEKKKKGRIQDVVDIVRISLNPTKEVD